MLTRTSSRQMPISLAALHFFLLWLRRPIGIGAVMPSGGRLARAIAGEIDTTAPGRVIELGGGTGQVTAALLEAGVPPQDLVVVEVEPSLCGIIGKRFPEVRVECADARELRALADRIALGPVKAVVSSLPLIAMSERTRRTILEQAIAVMGAEGTFVQFTYGPVSPVSRALQSELGLVGVRGRWIRLNVPPATVWRYRRERAAAPIVQTADAA
jgi:phosphatidylethanolamine/phosphatidyl-N-methylethanolamine N-methyltransferase